MAAPLRITRRMPIPRGRPWLVAGVVGLALALLLPLALELTSQAQIWLVTIAYAEVFAILALGLNVVVGFAGLLDLGYAAF